MKGLKLTLWLIIATIIILMNHVSHVSAVNELYIDMVLMIHDTAPPAFPNNWPYGDVDGMKGWLYVPDAGHGQPYLIDSAGNTFDVWCVDPDGSWGINKTYTTDEQYGMRFIKPGVTYWVARCPYYGGSNSQRIYFLDNNNDSGFTSFVDTFTRTWWRSTDTYDDDDDGFNDSSVWEYNALTNKLSYFLYENDTEVRNWAFPPPTTFRNLPFSRGHVGTGGGIIVPIDKFKLMASTSVQSQQSWSQQLQQQYMSSVLSLEKRVNEYSPIPSQSSISSFST